MVDALASDRSDQPFGEAVLPRRAWGDGLVADAHGAQSVRDGSAIDAIPIADQVARRLSPRECFGDLACDPVRGRMGCDVDPDKVSGRMIVMALSTDGNHRYSRTKNKRSPFVSWTRPRTLRCSTIS